MLHGRDREAAELAVRHMPAEQVTATPTGRDQSMGPVQQLDELAPLLGQVASGLTPADLDAPTPCADFTVRGLLGHLIGGATQFAAAFAGAPPPDMPADVAEGPDVVERAGAALGELVGAIQTPGALDQTLSTPFGEWSGETFARYIVLDGLVHGWDLAVATGQPYEPSAQLVGEAERFAHEAIHEDMRDGDTFAAEVEAPTNASPIERLVAFTGRSPFAPTSTSSSTSATTTGRTEA